MNGAERQRARAGLDPARVAVGRLDREHSSEDLAADLVEIWRAIEDSLRILVGSSVLTGQPLIREARQRQLIDFEQANALAELQAAHDRLHDPSYAPTAADLTSARTAVQRLEAALSADAPVGAAAAGYGMGSPPPPPHPDPRPQAMPITGEVKSAPPAVDPLDVADAGPIKVVPPPRRFSLRLMIGAGVALVLVLLAAGAYVLLFPRRSTALEQGINAYRAGQREIAASDFSRAVREDPSSPLPHIYLARMAREVGNTTLASQELQLALQADPGNAIALREMGANLLTQGNYDLARRFYVRAVQADPSDTVAIGYLGCTLMRLNRQAEAVNFLNRAGPGPWSNCTPAPPNGPNTGGARGLIPR